MRRSTAYIVLAAAGAAAVAIFFVAGAARNGDWVQVPRGVYEYDELPSEQEVIRGFLEANDRVVLAVPKEGAPKFISEDEVDRISKEGLENQYLNFYKKGWTHRIRLSESSVQPNFEINGSRYYVIRSSGTEAWNSSTVLNKFVGKEVEIKGKWDSFMIPDYASPEGVTQFRPRSIREARTE